MAVTGKRPYQLKRRAERQAQTRERIIEAAIGLYEEFGPSRTTISAIANRAQVQRLTVYRHFPDDSLLALAAAQRHLERYPLPNMTDWFVVRDPVTRLRRGLTEMYAFYRASARATASVLGDERARPALRDGLKPLLEPLSMLPRALSDGWPTMGPDGRRKLAAVIGHALDFTTWRSLTVDGRLTDEEAVGVLVSLAQTTARGD